MGPQVGPAECRTQEALYGCRGGAHQGVGHALQAERDAVLGVRLEAGTGADAPLDLAQVVYQVTGKIFLCVVYPEDHR